jgi:cytochrome c oxidase cbb3-type subunit III
MNKPSLLDRITIAPLMLALMIGCTGCERETRSLHALPSQATTMSQRGAGMATTSLAERYEKNAYALSQGKQLFKTYNCSGCHAQGGGGSGPALMDDVWIYGAEPEDVFASIAQGRANGMPSFGGRIPEYQIWQLVAYVRSMTGLVSADATPGRNDAMQAKPSEQLADKQPPRPPDASTDSGPRK